MLAEPLDRLVFNFQLQEVGVNGVIGPTPGIATRTGVIGGFCEVIWHVSGLEQHHHQRYSSGGRSLSACHREQGYLMPPSIKEWLPEEDLAWFTLDLVEQID